MQGTPQNVDSHQGVFPSCTESHLPPRSPSPSLSRAILHTVKVELFQKAVQMTHTHCHPEMPCLVKPTLYYCRVWIPQIAQKSFFLPFLPNVESTNQRPFSFM